MVPRSDSDTTRRLAPPEMLLPQRQPFPVDVADRGDEFRVTADLPGLRKQDIDVTVRKDRLRIAADFGHEDTEGRIKRRERPRGEVARVLRLPQRVDERRVSAAYEDGVLWVTLRKRDRPKRVAVE